MAQGTASHVEVPLERFLPTKVEDGRTEKCLCSVEQTTMGFVTVDYSIFYLVDCDRLSRVRCCVFPARRGVEGRGQDLHKAARGCAVGDHLG